MESTSGKKKEIDWSSLGFNYLKTDLRYVATCEEGEWSPGELTDDNIVNLNESSPVLHYGQACFEGMKAQTARDGRILLFRPGMNFERMNRTAERLLMPSLPKDLFFDAIYETVRANYAWIPPYGTGASLYVRPLLIGIGENLAVQPARKYAFRVFVCPVGPYYREGSLLPISLAVTDINRAAPRGTGNVKAGANYVGSLMASRNARELGADEALYLDSQENRYIEETGSSNIVIAMTGDRFVTPYAPASILPSVTRQSIMTLAEYELGMQVEERPVDLAREIADFCEVGACGTAAVITPVARIYLDPKWYVFNDGKTGPVVKQLYDALTQIQRGERDDPYGWTHEVEI